MKKEYHCDEKTEISVNIPNNKETLVAFELRMYSDCYEYDGGYYAEVMKKSSMKSGFPLQLLRLRKKILSVKM